MKAEHLAGWIVVCLVFWGLMIAVVASWLSGG
jgi:hypothetical protein